MDKVSDTIFWVLFNFPLNFYAFILRRLKYVVMALSRKYYKLENKQ